MEFFTDRRASWASWDETVHDKVLLDVDRNYVRKNSTDQGEEMEVGVEEEDDLKNNIKCQIILRVDPVEQDPSLYCIKVSTNHPSFKLQKSCVFRSFCSFYFLARILSSSFDVIPELSLKHLLWNSSQNTKILQLATFLFQVTSSRDILASKAVHLFLQTQLSMEFIQDNVEGKRNDKVTQPAVENKYENHEPFKMQLTTEETNQENWLKHIIKKPVQGRNRRRSFRDHLALIGGNVYNINILSVLNESE